MILMLNEVNIWFAEAIAYFIFPCYSIYYTCNAIIEYI